MMIGSALRRLMAEYRQLTLNPPEGASKSISQCELCDLHFNSFSILLYDFRFQSHSNSFANPFDSLTRPGIIAGPVDEENFFEWEALITGKNWLFKPAIRK